MSALLSNDIVCLAVAPVLVQVCASRKANPIPVLLGLACAANIGSSSTLIGNPQNMLIGQVMHLSFFKYLMRGLPVAILGTAVAWSIISFLFRNAWERDFTVPEQAERPFDAQGALKGALVLCSLIVMFLISSENRDIWALAGAGIILVSHRRASRSLLELVDWQLLILFAGLFIVNHAVAASGATEVVFHDIEALGITVTHPGTLLVLSTLLSNIVTNVPAVMLLLPAINTEQAATLLALSSTLAGNLLIIGSIANIIVLDQAAKVGILVNWRQHALVGIPVTIATLLICWVVVLV